MAELGVPQIVGAQQRILGKAKARVGDLGEPERVEAVVGRGVLQRRDARDLLELVVERRALEDGRGLRRDRRGRGGGEGEGRDELHFCLRARVGRRCAHVRTARGACDQCLTRARRESATVRYCGGRLLAAECIYATALLLRAGRTASRSVVRRGFALSDALHCRGGGKESKYGLDTIATLFGTVSES